MRTGRLKDVCKHAQWFLPDGFEVRITIEHGHVDVTLWADDGEFLALPDSGGDNLAEQVATAVREACTIFRTRSISCK